MEAALQSIFDSWDEVLLERGRKISEDMIETMLLGRDEEALNLRIVDRELKLTGQFRYLGVCFGTENHTF